MESLSRIKKSIELISNGIRKQCVLLAKVVETVGEQCTVEIDGLKLTEVRLRSVINGNNSKVLITPKTGSYVSVLDSFGDMRNLLIVGYSEIERVEIDCDDKVVINGGKLGGLVKIKELEDNLENIKEYLSSMNAAISTGINAVGAAMSANGATGKLAYESAMAGKSIIFEDMENKNVTH